MTLNCNLQLKTHNKEPDLISSDFLKSQSNPGTMSPLSLITGQTVCPFWMSVQVRGCKEIMKRRIKGNDNINISCRIAGKLEMIPYFKKTKQTSNLLFSTEHTALSVQVGGGSFILHDCADRNSVCSLNYAHLFSCFHPLSLLRASTQSTGISLSQLLRRRWSMAGWTMRKRRRSFLRSETLRVTTIP